MIDEEIRFTIRNEIRKAKEQSSVEVIFSIFMLIVILLLIHPLVTEVILPYWAEATQWGWLVRIIN